MCNMKLKCVDLSFAAKLWRSYVWPVWSPCANYARTLPHVSTVNKLVLNKLVQWVCARGDVSANCGTSSARVHVKVQLCTSEGYPVHFNPAVADCVEIFSKTPLLIWSLSLNLSPPLSSLHTVFWVFCCSFISSSPGRYCPGQYQERPNNTYTLSVSITRFCL